MQAKWEIRLITSGFHSRRRSWTEANFDNCRCLEVKSAHQIYYTGSTNHFRLDKGESKPVRENTKGLGITVVIYIIIIAPSNGWIYAFS